MAGERSYRWGWHPDRPQDRLRHRSPGSDVTDPEATAGWVTTASFAALVGMGEVPVSPASVAKCCRAGLLRAERVGGRWRVDAEQAEPLAIRLAEHVRTHEAQGKTVVEAGLEPMRKLGRSAAADSFELTGEWQVAISLNVRGGPGTISVQHRGRTIAYPLGAPQPTEEEMDRILAVRDAVRDARRQGPPAEGTPPRGGRTP